MATSGPVESDAFVAGQSKVPVSKWQGFLTFLYNSKEGTVLGRTGKSWLQITIFYIIFYGVLAAFFSVLLILFLQTLDPKEPKWQGTNGIIGNTPGKELNLW
jgi:sodium/potassium-transporting ATPase subunit beta